MARKTKKQKSRASRRARFRAFRKRTKKRAGKGITSQWGKISSAIGVIAFLAQVTGKERAGGLYTGQTMGNKLKLFTDNVLTNILGVAPFGNRIGDGQSKFPNIDGIANKFTGFGLASFIYGHLPIRALPHRPKAKTLGKALVVAGILGGLFDSPENDTRNRVISQRPALRVPAQGNQVTTS